MECCCPPRKKLQRLNWNMEKHTANAAIGDTATFFALVQNRLKFSLYLLKNLPAAYFSGVRIVEANDASAVVSIPYKWFTRNPFRSTYFASLSMAAELSTGLLAMAHLYKRKPSVALLVTGIEGKFYKKATAFTFFHCEEGSRIKQTIDAAVLLAAPQEIKAHTVGKNKAGELVAEFWITWSFKVR